MSTISVPVSDDRIASLLCSGFEGGSGYWLRIMDYQVPAEPRGHLEGLEDEIFRHVDYPLCEGGAVICRVMDEGNDEEYKPLVLDRAAIDRGLALFPVLAPHAFGHWMERTDDAGTGDVFLQLCLLGELVYG